MLGDVIPVRINLWDGSTIAPTSSDVAGTLRLVSPDAVRRLLWSPNELGLARAFVAGELEFDGDIFEVVAVLRAAMEAAPRPLLRSTAEVLTAARRLQLVGRPLPPPPEEARLHGGRHSERRDAEAIGRHYDVGNDFYSLTLGPSMTYSCARFVEPDTDLASAQAAKHELICRKLGLPDRPGARLLDVGCGWGSMAIHAATHHDVSVVGITISGPQAEEARKRVAAAGVADRVEIRLQDYRRLAGERFDAISSIGMAEHVGQAHIDRYFELLHAALTPPRPPAQPRHQRRRRLPHQASLVHRPLRLPGRRADRRRRLGAGDGGGGLRGPRRRVAPRALHPDVAQLGEQPGGSLGRGGRPGRSTPGSGVAAVHGRLGRVIRRRLEQPAPVSASSRRPTVTAACRRPGVASIPPAGDGNSPAATLSQAAGALGGGPSSRTRARAWWASSAISSGVWARSLSSSSRRSS